MEGGMRRHLAACLFALSFVLGVSSKGLAGADFTTIDFAGATATSAWGINSRGDSVGQYLTHTRAHGFLLLGGKFAPIYFRDAARGLTSVMNGRGGYVGQ